MIRGNGSKKIEAVFEENIHLKFRVAKCSNDFQSNSLFK